MTHQTPILLGPRCFSELLGKSHDFGARQTGVRNLFERDAIARDELTRREPDHTVGIDRDLDEHEHVTRRRFWKIGNSVFTEGSIC